MGPTTAVDADDLRLGWAGGSEESAVVGHVPSQAHDGRPTRVATSVVRVRVVAGRLRGRRILAPPTPRTRPTTDRVREATFNALASMGAIEGASVVDLFAGSGALGIEALSRGAASAVFVERDAAAVSVLRENLATLGLTDSARVVVGDALVALRSITDATLVVADPPYGFDGWRDLLALVATHLPSARLVVAESEGELDPEGGDLEGWECVRAKRYGRTHVTILRRLA